MSMVPRRTVTPGSAMTESGVRTVADLVVGAVLAWLTGQIVKSLSPGDPVFSSEMVSGVLWAGWTVVSAIIKRKFWPVQTDNAGRGRTDLPADSSPSNL